MCCHQATPFTPDNILAGDDGRWYHDGVDVTDLAIWWKCSSGHSWQASLGHRTSSADIGCADCVALSDATA